MKKIYHIIRSGFVKSLCLNCILLTGWMFSSCVSEKKGIVLESKMQYADLLSITEESEYYKVDIINPWDTTRLLQQLILTDDIDKPGLPDGIRVKIPLQNSLVMTAVHCSLLEELECSDAISSVCDAGFINSPILKAQIESGRVVDCGNSMIPSMEKIISVRPDAMLISPYEKNNLAKLENLRIPIVMCADYMETTPLGRAEWMKFYGILYGSKELSDSLFHAIEERYLSLKSVVSKVTNRPSVLSEKRMGQVWFVPGVRSTIGHLYADAGASNPFAGMESRNGSVSLSPEQVLQHAKDADVWLLKSDKDIGLRSLAEENPIYQQFSSYQSCNVWTCNTMESYYYEKAPFHPDLLLADFIRIFHPELKIPGDNTFYFKTR